MSFGVIARAPWSRTSGRPPRQQPTVLCTCLQINVADKAFLCGEDGGLEDFNSNRMQVICYGNFVCQFTLVGVLYCTKNLACTLELVTLLSKSAWIQNNLQVDFDSNVRNPPRNQASNLCLQEGKKLLQNFNYRSILNGRRQKVWYRYSYLIHDVRQWGVHDSLTFLKPAAL